MPQSFYIALDAWMDLMRFIAAFSFVCTNGDIYYLVAENKIDLDRSCFLNRLQTDGSVFFSFKSVPHIAFDIEDLKADFPTETYTNQYCDDTRIASLLQKLEFSRINLPMIALISVSQPERF